MSALGLFSISTKFPHCCVFKQPQIYYTKLGNLLYVRTRVHYSIMAVSQLRLMTSRAVFNNFLQRISTKSSRHSFKSKTEAVPEDQDDELNQPIKYSTSPAAEWAARHSFRGEKDDDCPWYQPHVVSVSVGIFLIYFLYLREANDIDAIFDRELGDYFGGVDNEQLRRKIAQNTGMPPGGR